MHARKFASASVSLAVGLLLNVASIAACQREATLGEAFLRYKTVAIAEVVDAGRADETGRVSATFRVQQVLQGNDATVDQFVTARTNVGSRAGDFAVIVANREGENATLTKPKFAVFSRIGISPSAVRYVESLPRTNRASAETLSFYIRFLEHEDETIAADAFGNFFNADLLTLKAVAKQLRRKSLRSWLKSEEIDVFRLRIYGLLLGLCGEAQDQALLHSKIVEEANQFRVGMDGVIAGYLLLSAEKGLEFVERRKLLDDSIPFGETYSAMMALRIVWTLSDDRKEDEGSSEVAFTKERLRQSMRILLDRPNLADLVIANLTRWSDWSQMDEVYSLYDAEEYDVAAIRRAIIRYFLAATHVENDRPNAKQLAKAEKYLAELKENDPKAVKAAERFFFLD